MMRAELSIFVIPAKAGTHLLSWRPDAPSEMDPRVRGDDEGFWGETL
jgi:hypothetical protein